MGSYLEIAVAWWLLYTMITSPIPWYRAPLYCRILSVCCFSLSLYCANKKTNNKPWRPPPHLLLSVLYNQDNFLFFFLTRRVLCCLFYFSLCLFIATKHRTAFNFSFIISSGEKKRRRIEPRPSLCCCRSHPPIVGKRLLMLSFFLFSLIRVHTHTHALCVYNPPSSLFLFLLVCDAIRIVYTIGIVIRQSPLRPFPLLFFF